MSIERDVFFASTSMILGDRKTALFLDDGWQAIVEILDEPIAESRQRHCRAGSYRLSMGCRHHQSS